MPDNPLEIKSFGAFEIKDEVTGEVGAVVATLNCVDKDGDVLLPGCLPDSSPVQMSSYGHSIITDNAPPVGKGVVTVEGDKAIFRGKFFMSSERGREAFAVVKELGAEGEWSWGFPRAVKTMPMTEEWKSKGARRLIADALPVEASPVFRGAGWNTGTMYAKSAEEPVVPDPAIEAARLKAEEDAKALADINARADRLFRREVAGIKR